MSIEAFRQKHGLPIKRGMRVEWFSWSCPQASPKRHLIRDFTGHITSVKGDEVHCKGHCWWAKAKFWFTLLDKNVVVYNEDGSILLDARELAPPEYEYVGALNG